MHISDVRVRKVMREGRLRAILSMVIDNSVAVHDIKIVQGDGRLFVAMPSRRDESGTFRDIVHPINADTRSQIEEAVLTAYANYTETEAITAIALEADEFGQYGDTAAGEPCLVV